MSTTKEQVARAQFDTNPPAEFALGDVIERGHEELMQNLEAAISAIEGWLGDNGIRPNWSIISTEDCESGYEIIFNIDTDSVDRYAEIGLDFWRHVREHIPLESAFSQWIDSPQFDPLNTVGWGKNKWLLSIVPDESSSRHTFPASNHWRSKDDACWREELRQRKRRR